MINSVIFASLLLGVSTAPAYADAGRQAAVAQSAQDAGGGSVTTAKPQEKMYCVKGVLTGSRLPSKECHSRQDWKKLGLDVDSPK